jgi:osmotically-inducible protein OsmY
MSAHRNARSALWAIAATVALTIGCAQTDAGVTTSVKSRLAADQTVKAYQIDVDTHDHVVTLSGEVDSAVARERAVALARQTEGVNSVVDNIRVGRGSAALPGEHNTAGTAGVIDDKARAAGDADGNATTSAREAADKAKAALKESGEALTDAAITTAVKSRLVANAAADAARIDVDTKDHVVTLTGTVSSAAEKAAALRAAREMSGVRQVRDKLVVQERR